MGVQEFRVGGLGVLRVMEQGIRIQGVALNLILKLIPGTKKRYVRA